MKVAFTLTWRIYFSMFMLVLVSFIITGAATYFNFIDQNEKYHIERINRKEAAILASINYYFHQEREGEFFPFYTKEFVDKINEFSDIHALTINIFDLNGILITSSDIIEYENSSMEKFVPQQVLQNLKSGQESVLLDQQRGKEDHLAVYSYLRNLEGTPIAIINMPYFFSLEPSNNEAYHFLRRLSLFYLILLLPALVLGFYLSQYITKSLRTIGDKIKTLRLNQKNEELSWKSKDEIGLLVEEYNKKVNELEKSFRLLAQSERELAWREMAKQVAHEIKNPLTPMKLSVQQLERAWNDNQTDFEDRIKRFSITMTEQIETLTKIANEFSSFAKMPKTKIERINLNTLVAITINLFEETGSGIHLSFENSYEDAHVKADKTELQRVFINLFKNAFQAIPEEKKGFIKVRLLDFANSWKIEVEDNGEGIPEKMKENLFIPNFTTKSTGMGLGLAMVKNIIDNYNGNVSFISKEGEGTIFTIDLPKA